MTETTDIEALAADMRDLADRIIECQGENSDGEDIIRLYDHSDTVFKAENILLVLDGLEAERQQRELLEVRARNVEAESKTSIRAVNTLSTEFAALHERCEKAEAELAALRGTQEPDHYRYSCGSCGYETLAYTSKCPTCNYHKIEEEPLFTHPPKPVVVRLERSQLSSSVSSHHRSYGDGYSKAIEKVTALLEPHGIVVKDGE